VTWQPLDPALDVTVSGSDNTYAHLGANADLWTDSDGYNQDIGIFITDTANPSVDRRLAWKESGGLRRSRPHQRPILAHQGHCRVD
jgi:hypothetical protein